MLDAPTEADRAWFIADKRVFALHVVDARLVELMVELMGEPEPAVEANRHLNGNEDCPPSCIRPNSAC